MVCRGPEHAREGNIHFHWKLHNSGLKRYYRDGTNTTNHGCTQIRTCINNGAPAIIASLISEAQTGTSWTGWSHCLCRNVPIARTRQARSQSKGKVELRRGMLAGSETVLSRSGSYESRACEIVYSL